MSKEATAPDVPAKGGKKEAKEYRRLLGVVPIPNFIATIFSLLVQGYLLYKAVYQAYDWRTIPIKEYGMLIHEFDPWFNFRATQYMSRHGWSAFFSWFDHMSWYPLGRPVGTTTYPGLQFTAVAIHRVLYWMGKPFHMSLNDVCCLIPAWFGGTSTLLLALLTYEATNSRTAAVAAASIFAIIPGHLMRSMAGGFDNECIAMTAMLATFYLWVVSLRSSRTWWIGLFAGVAYGYMVAAWGGFTFVLNMVALHAFTCAIAGFLQNTYSSQLHKSYTLFFIVGTSLALLVPPIGLSPFKSLEQLSALLVFVGLQVLYLANKKCEEKKCGLRSLQGIQILISYFVTLLAGIATVIVLLYPTGWFGPLSSRVRGLFVKHTKTGNPLVDSVAEHQPASADAYWRFLHYAYYGWGVGCALMPFLQARGKAILFLVVYSVAGFYFCNRMSRLILLASPIASASSGLVIGVLFDFAVSQVFYGDSEDAIIPAHDGNESGDIKKNKSATAMMFKNTKIAIVNLYKKARLPRQAIALALVAVAYQFGLEHRQTFELHSQAQAYTFASPKIAFKVEQKDGRVVKFTDYLDSYKWLKEKTPQDARIMAWWDYGYQITGIGNRTTIADGNTWNHEHIGMLGKCMTGPLKESYDIIRHLADYVLIWSGGRSSDINKSRHMAKIAHSVFEGTCGSDPNCGNYGFYSNDHDRPTPMMKDSLLFHLHFAGEQRKEKFELNGQMFELVHKSPYNLVKIFKVKNVAKDTKAWLADPANRLCKAPGDWECPGQYPPVPQIKALLAKKKDFAQLEDFNKKK